MENKFYNNQRTWGVEIEFKGNRHLAAIALRNEGINVQIEGYNHTDRNYWKIVMDGSAEWELVSPPLSGEEGFRQLEIACKALQAAGVKVDKSCGLHVHHGVNDLSVDNFKNLYKLYYKFEETIDEFMPESRRANNNTYCKSMKGSYEMEKILQAKTLMELENIYWDRYYKLNIQSYVKHGTIEFRQHNGTIEFDKISNWIKLTNMMVERSKVRTSLNERQTATNKTNWDKMKNCLGIAFKNEVGKFYNGRIVHFQNRNNRISA